MLTNHPLLQKENTLFESCLIIKKLQNKIANIRLNFLLIKSLHSSFNIQNGELIKLKNIKAENGTQSTTYIYIYKMNIQNEFHIYIYMKLCISYTYKKFIL